MAKVDMNDRDWLEGTGGGLAGEGGGGEVELGVADCTCSGGGS